MEMDEKEILNKCLTQSAQTYFDFVKLHRPEVYSRIKQDLINLYMNGRIKARITVERLKIIVREAEKKLKRMRSWGRMVA